MKLNTLLFITPLLTLSLSVFAKPMLSDSVGVENLDGKKVILHKLDPKDNYYSISRLYNVKPGAIILFNNNAPLKIGAIIKVPTDRPFSDAVKPVVAAKPAPPVEKPVNANVTSQQYKVSAGETLYGIAKRFDSTVEDIVKLNGLTSTTVTPGQVIQVRSAAQEASQQPKPAPVVVQQAEKPVAQSNTDATIQQYKVSAGETLYGIAKRFNSTVEDITKLNGLTSNTVSPGQILKIRSADDVPQPAKPVTAPVAEHPIMKRDSTTYALSQDSIDRNIKNPSRYGLYEKNEKGVATWMDDDTGLDPNKKLVLHRTAPIGTVIKITNPMNNRTTFAKVVGGFTDNETTKDVIIVMTKNVAESIGAMDKRVHVNISYGSPE